MQKALMKNTQIVSEMYADIDDKLIDDGSLPGCRHPGRQLTDRYMN